MSEIKVNKISPRTACGTTTLGDSGDTFTIPSGVTITNNGTQTGFGRTGTVDWQTSIKTATFTAASGEGYFCNTSGGAFTVNLPSSPSVGDIVAIKDYGSSFATNNLTIGRGGSNLNGVASDSVRSTDNESLTLVYADATKGWLAVEEGTGFVGASFITATGGTITTSGNCKIHTFTGPGTFTVCSIATCSANNIVSYVVVAGGGGGAQSRGGGGGAGGYREVKNPVTPYTASPLDGYPSSPNRITVTATNFPITVGGGGGGGTCAGPSACGIGCSGSNSSFSTITAAGGGGAAPGCANFSPYGPTPVQRKGLNGGSGGGGGSGNDDGGAGGTGNTPPVSPAQGTNGGSAGGSNNRSGGGGGATAAGAGGTGYSPDSGNGGAGATSSINATPTARAGGGGGGAGNTPAAGSGGTGGGGAGSVSGTGTAGTTNTGGGGGGGGANSGQDGGNGGSGIVIIRYKFQ